MTIRKNLNNFNQNATDSNITNIEVVQRKMQLELNNITKALNNVQMCRVTNNPPKTFIQGSAIDSAATLSHIFSFIKELSLASYADTRPRESIQKNNLSWLRSQFEEFLVYPTDRDMNGDYLLYVSLSRLSADPTNFFRLV